MFERTLASIPGLVLALAFAPLLLGVINRTKAFFAGRHGQPLLQTYYDVAKLLRKGAVYSRTTSWVFRAGPVVGLAAVLGALAIVPLGGAPATLSFSGDMVLLAYWLGLMRFFTVLAALDTGSAFEGMGASREVQFSALAEPALLLGLAALVKTTGELSLTGVYATLSPATLWAAGPVMFLVAAALVVVFLTENARIPIDDPNTHLELTMIHEVMVLDHSGPDFALITYAASLKLWVLGALVVGVVLPVRTGYVAADLGVALAGMLGLAVVTGVIESTMARLRLLRVPHLLAGAIVLAALALVLAWRH
ncbi:MAG: NADH-quinone oxidoreductase subunit H [Acidobacteria bacterium]|nr:NADH-quinone oxidoreductase subunit H [Acidobacteriota bacterium]